MTVAAAFARVGELACQRNPFLRELRARVVSCEPVALRNSSFSGVGSKKKSSNHSADVNMTTYDVVLTDSVLFPEGGGQPCDYGTIIVNNNNNNNNNSKEISVRSVQRRGDMCVISLPCELKIGEEVEMRVDWPRRLDHMQHHSAQHLLSAVVLNTPQCNLPTTSWSLTHPLCFIVLPTGKRIEQAVVDHIETACNEAIARAVPVRCDIYASSEAYEESLRKREENKKVEKSRKTRGIPSDMTGSVRVITIEESIDQCTCCGTHVTNLAQLQMIKLLHQEAKGDTLKLFFITGDRLRSCYTGMYSRERELMKELGGVRPQYFVETVIKKGKDIVGMEKKLRNLTLELVKAESEKLIMEAKASAKESSGGDNNNNKCGGFVMYRRDDVDADFFNALRDILREACPQCLAVFAWAAAPATGGGGEPPAGVGQFMVVGPEERVQAVAPCVIKELEGKGGMSKFGYRGKGSLAGWKKLAEKLQSLVM